jgi:hypothetical protein
MGVASAALLGGRKGRRAAASRRAAEVHETQRTTAWILPRHSPPACSHSRVCCTHQPCEPLNFKMVMSTLAEFAHGLEMVFQSAMEVSNLKPVANFSNGVDSLAYETSSLNTKVKIDDEDPFIQAASRAGTVPAMFCCPTWSGCRKLLNATPWGLLEQYLFHSSTYRHWCFIGVTSRAAPHRRQSLPDGSAGGGLREQRPAGSGGESS